MLLVKLPQVMINMFVRKVPELLFGHPSEKRMHKIGVRKMIVLLHLRNPRCFLCGHITLRFGYP